MLYLIDKNDSKYSQCIKAQINHYLSSGCNPINKGMLMDSNIDDGAGIIRWVVWPFSKDRARIIAITLRVVRLGATGLYYSRVLRFRHDGLRENKVPAIERT